MGNGLQWIAMERTNSESHPVGIGKRGQVTDEEHHQRRSISSC